MRITRKLAAICLAIALTSSLPTTAMAQPALRKVTVGVLYLVADAGLFIAKDRGYFAQEGLDVEFTRFSSGGDVVALLATNRLDVGSGSATPGLFNSYIRGVVAPIVSSKAILSKEDLTGSALVVRKDLIDSGRVKTMADLKGMRDYKRAIFDGKGDRNATCALINKHLPFVPPDCSGISMSHADGDGVINVKSLEEFQDEWVKWGLMRERANIAANVNADFVNFAVSRLGKYQP